MPDEYERFLQWSATKYSGDAVANKWVLCSTDGEQTYYFNAVTREISWERPSDYVDSVAGLNHVEGSKTGQRNRIQSKVKDTTNEKSRSSKKYPFAELEEE